MIKERYGLLDKLRLSELFEEKAKRFLEGAKSAMNYGDYSGAVHKAYYSIFHLSKAYLFLLGEDPETHRGVKHLMNLYLFIQPQYRKLARIFDLLYTLRQESDYDVLGDLLELERVEEAIKLAEEYHKILFELIASLRKNLSEGL
ncbi:MAG: HEPN domain-containing protein [Aquificaceae bacterium]